MEAIQKEEINEALKQLESTIQGATQENRPHTKIAEKWFDTECYRERREVITALHRIKTNKNNSTEDLKRYADARRNYKALLRKKKTTFWEEEGNKWFRTQFKTPT